MKLHGPIAGLAAAGLMLHAGCNDKPAPPAVVAPQVSPRTPAAPAPAPAAATPAAPAPAPAPDDGPRNDPGIEALNIAIGDYFSANGTVPKDISELVRGKFLDKPPVPPPGKRYVIDPTRRQAKLAGK
ncbi:MAG: hypothetical protein FJ386_10355 [Verrucomicrobia bacterium]|nr:hypothetical protein [Verrucomicrobiota bacterium]